MAEIGSRKRKASEQESTSATEPSCPYLDTIQRSLLDFDFEPACSVSLQSGPHIYCCLVCGLYFRGRGPHTPAYTHSVEESHFVYVHLEEGTFWCLPDSYQVNDSSLNDIAEALHPTFTKEQIQNIDANTSLSRDFFGRRYLPGFVGLNNLQKTDGINALVQALVHVTPLRDFFLSRTHKDKLVKHVKDANRQAHYVAQCFGELVRKMWSPRRFKSTVDPHMLIQAITTASKKRFQVGVQAEAGDILSWMLNQLHIGTGGSKKAGSSIIHTTFQGRVRVTTKSQKKQVKNGNSDEDDRLGSDDESKNESDEKIHDQIDSIEETSVETNFLHLTLDIPEKPLFRDKDGGLVIPQEPLVSVLRKFDGITFSDAISQSGSLQRKRYQLLQLPTFLILHLTRFSKNRYKREKNPTIVAFPVKNFDLSSYIHDENGKPPTPDEIRSMNVKEIKQLLARYNHSDIAKDAVEKTELVNLTIDFVSTSLPNLLKDKYDLVANITHDSPAEVGREGKHDPLQEGSYKCHVQHAQTKQWYEMQDLHVQEIMPQQIGVSESYVLIFRRST